MPTNICLYPTYEQYIGQTTSFLDELSTMRFTSKVIQGKTVASGITRSRLA